MVAKGVQLPLPLWLTRRMPPLGRRVELGSKVAVWLGARATVPAGEKAPPL